MSARVAKANILNLRDAAIFHETKMAALPIAGQLPNIEIKATKLKRSIFLLHPTSLGILGGLLGVIIIGVVVPALPARAVATPSQPVPASTPVASAAPTTSPAKATAIVHPTDRLTINRLGTNAPIIQVGLTKAGAIDTPKTLWQVGHYSNSAVVGANSTAVLVGHSGAPGQVGVFEHINRIQVGDIITYTRADGTAISFKAVSSHAYPVNDASARTLVAGTPEPSLNLISCYGHWDQTTEEYDQRWIVKAQLVK